MPSARRRSSFARRVARSSELSSSAIAALRDVDLSDLELALLAAGQGHVDRVAALVLEQRLADRGLVGELLLPGVRLGRADDRVLVGVAGLLVLDVHGHADLDDVGRQLGRVDDLRGAQALLELGDLLLEHHLLVLGVVVLGVLRDVAELAGLLDALGHLATLGGLQVVELALKRLETLGSEDDVLGHWRGSGVGGRRPRHETPLSGGESSGATWLDERRSIAPCYAAAARVFRSPRTARASVTSAVDCMACCRALG